MVFDPLTYIFCPIGRHSCATRRLGAAAGLGPCGSTYRHFADCADRILPGDGNAEPPETGKLRMAAPKCG